MTEFLKRLQRNIAELQEVKQKKQYNVYILFVLLSYLYACSISSFIGRRVSIFL